MNTSNQGKTAIIIFANSSKEELKHKAIVNGQQLFDTLTGITLQTVKKTKLPYFHFTEKEQLGNSFGERFSNAIHKVLSQGFDNVIAIGNDTPKLTTASLLKAEKELNKNKLVLGPSMDGGFYLMGINKSHFKFEIFKNLPWQTKHIRKSVVHGVTLNQQQQVVFLSMLVDLDTQDDLKKAFNYSLVLPKELVKIVLQILQTVQVYTTIIYLIVYDILHPNYFNKGSPVVLQS